jgi:hypothetical protein
MKTFDQNNEILIYTHIPKCGGTSLHDWLLRAFNDNYLTIISPNIIDNQNFSLYKGFGGHQYYGDNPKDFNGKVPVYISVMRNPISRFISYYNHVLNNKNHYSHKYIINSDPLTFAHSLYNINNGEISNLQVKMLNNNRENENWIDALNNIKKNYIIVGCFENMNEFYNKLSNFLKVSPLIKVNYLNISNKNNIEYSNSYLKELNDYILEINNQDYALYKAIFENNDTKNI